MGARVRGTGLGVGAGLMVKSYKSAAGSDPELGRGEA